MKKTFLLAVIFFFGTNIYSQNLVVQTDGSGHYILHTVVAKENFYSIGRIYHITPQEIASFNSLDMSRGLSTGQLLKIPLTNSNFSQTAESGKAVFYIVGSGEGLYRVSVKNNNVPMDNIRKWNRLESDNLNAGQKLIVGFITPAAEGSVSGTKPVADYAEAPVEPMPVVEARQDKKPEPVQATTEEKKTAPGIKAQPAVISSDPSGGGYFRQQYEKQVRVRPATTDKNVIAGIFKTSSGWQDSKFYLLIDHVEPGTIVKLVNPENNKAVYAKVLGQMSGIRQNQGYDIRMSNATASALGVSETEKFMVRITY